MDSPREPKFLEEIGGAKVRRWILDRLAPSSIVCRHPELRGNVEYIVRKTGGESWRLTSCQSVMLA